MATPFLEVRSVSKRFPGVRALIDVSLTVAPGEVVAVIGENGAGKSTLMKILAGVQEPDEGEIRVEGRPLRIPDVRTAEQAGIVLIHQELNLCGNLDVASSLYLGRESHRFGFIRRAELEKSAATHLQRVGLDCSPRTLVSSLSLGRQQMVEIARALSTDARLLIMDEPTSSLSQGETDQLYRVVHDLRRRGVSVVYISHRLGEVRELADRVVVLRDGRNAGELGKTEISHDNMVRLMVGRDIGHAGRRPAVSGGGVVASNSNTNTPDASFRVEELRTPAFPRIPLSFSISPGEIVGLAGLVGAGRTELLRSLFGIDRPVGGRVVLRGKTIDLSTPRNAIREGLALVPEDRKTQGVILEMEVDSNTLLPSLHQLARFKFRRIAAEARCAKELTTKLRVKTPHLRQWVQFLSGGNQQKVVLAKWLALSPKVLLLDEPTRGIDVGAKQEIYRLMEDLAAGGVMILFVSSEMEEILRMSDRALVMHQGRITGELTAGNLSEEAVMHLATGNARA